MKRYQYRWNGVRVEVSHFGTDAGTLSRSGLEEINAILHVEGAMQLRGQHAALCEGLRLLLAQLPGARIICRRWFCADVRAVRALAEASGSVNDSSPAAEGAVAFVGQPPLDGGDIALWVYMVRGEGVEVETSAGTTILRHEGRAHCWDMDIHSPGGSSAEQTARILEGYEGLLLGRGAVLADDCVRTWFFVDDIDTNYSGVVVARRENFETQGLTAQTHYISSTGICGASAPEGASVQFGAYSVLGLETGQQKYLYAPTHLNPTYEYGVTFERGTRVAYGDRIHSIISGTASINNLGEVVHVGDVAAQTLRMLENIGALLTESGAKFDELVHLIVYLRNASDYEIVAPIFAERFPTVPTVFTLAPVCRPDWLIETECVTVTPGGDPAFRPF